MKDIRHILYFNRFTVAGVNECTCIFGVVFLPDGGRAAAGLCLCQARKQVQHPAVYLQAFVRLGDREELFTGIFISVVGCDVLKTRVCDRQDGEYKALQFIQRQTDFRNPFFSKEHFHKGAAGIAVKTKPGVFPRGFAGGLIVSGCAGGNIESLSGVKGVGFALCFQSSTAFQDKMDEMIGFHIESILIPGAALLDAAVVKLQGQETDSSPVDQKVPVSEHNSTSFL